MMSGQFHVSVIVTTFNRPRLLHRCLRALSSQEVGGFTYDIIVVDDCSSPTNLADARKICAEYENVRFQVNEKNVGLSSSRNNGARNASGDILLFLDDDIIVEPKYVQGHTDLFYEYENIATVGSLRFPPELCAKDNLVRYLSSREMRQRKLSAEMVKNLAPGQFGGGICGIMKRDYNRIGGFSEEFIHYGLEDVAMGTCLKRAGITIMLATAANADHHDRVTMERYKTKTIESARYGLRLLLEKYPDAFENKLSKYLLPDSKKDTTKDAVIKLYVRMIFNRITGRAIMAFAQRTNHMPFLFSKTLLHALFTCWMIEGMKMDERQIIRSSAVEYSEK